MTMHLWLTMNYWAQVDRMLKDEPFNIKFLFVLGVTISMKEAHLI